jgi:murein DD-endopeptidase MepM/ murein hydrolase activator NlpD
MALLSLVGLLAAPTALAEGDLPLTIRIHARAVAPGEPLRVEVVSREPLDSVEGTFLGHTVFMVRQGSSDAGEHWSGWTMVALDEESGVSSLELHGTSAAGRPVVGTHAVTVEAKEFPEEHLSVASKYVSPPPEVEERLARERKKLRAIYESRRQFVPGEEPFVRPVPGDPTSTFGTRRLYNGKPRSPHPGLDLRASTGTPVLSSGSGLVVLSQDLYYSGNTVIVDHGGGLFTIYAHLSELQAEEGHEIAAGEVVGLSGATGRVTGPHLHWGAKIGSRPFDPQALLDPALF